MQAISTTAIPTSLPRAVPPHVAGALEPEQCLQVTMGKLKIGARTDQLQALLGSCVGIGFIWKKRNCCGLAHCLLPEAPGYQDELGARYVSQAVPSLLMMMGATEADYADIEVIVAGGANMLSCTSNRLQIGQQNTAAAHKYLSERGLNVQHCCVGGTRGRMLTIDCATHSFAVNELGKFPQGTSHASN